ncbi:type II toxin-antitoxin system Phd/YefM family antitoxin [Actinomadura madurae]|uniref:type II toxin-antitoxin system Phd/YefM family antitoxin n=1 Tax=Actinomadura madurae TaxID=1993 RepID=UPI0020D2551C|nr:hypothetical protein [Actinomadura madurae]MCP9947297.1 hypothetical protein [Actinomadura madurae]MCP9964058.1 hypothetical protein [Actinomadura madurae]MCP9976532.1 hypothetical protein [Actinomadura madurae]MCQ0011970.1 hypothetical protein [Actinomadura madurae]MCQ0012729.1 hypothetical protein [Actinomadura madurae]
MKSREARDNWRETLRHVENGGEVVIEHYNRPIARIVPIEEPAMANTVTTEYGSWNTKSGTGLDTVTESVAAALGEHADDFDVDAIATDYAAAINEALADTGISLHGREFYGPYPRRDDVGIRAIVEGVDLWGIVAKHEK